MTLQLSTFYLPVSRGTAEGFLGDDAVPLRVIERVGLFAMLMAGRPAGLSREALPGKILDAEAGFGSLAPDAVAAFLRQMRDDAPFRAMDDVVTLLEAQGIQFAPAEQMDHGAWRGADGRYTPVFQELCRNTLLDYEISVADMVAFSADRNDHTAEDDDTDPDAFARMPRRRVTVRGTTDQARAASAVAAAPDEQFAMTAYAGSGKTHLLLRLVEGGGRFTHVAPTAAHQHAFGQRVGGARVESVTLHRLAARMAAAFVRQAGTRWVKPPASSRHAWAMDRLAHMADVPSIAGDTPSNVLWTVHTAIRRWCHGGDRDIGSEHFPRPGPQALADRMAYVAVAQKVWTMMFDADMVKETGGFPLRDYHLVKWLDISGATIPSLGTLLVDEAHDLPAPWFALFDRYPEGVVMMSDPYQRLSGRVPPAPHAKALTMVQSVRTGEHAMPVVRSVLDLHSERLVPDTILGSRDHVTRHRFYAPNDELPASGLRVFGSEWQLLEDALRLKEAGARFRLVPQSASDFGDAAKDAILLREHGDRPRSYHLRRFSHWDALAQHLHELGLARIARLFERGFSMAHLDELLAAQSMDDEPALTLGLLEHCKNLEFDVVTLSMSCFSSARQARSRDDDDERVRAIYVAVTRVRNELWLPADALERLADQVAQRKAAHA